MVKKLTWKILAGIVLIAVLIIIWGARSRAIKELGGQVSRPAAVQEELNIKSQTIRVGSRFQEVSIPYGYGLYFSNTTPTVIIDVRVNGGEPQTLAPGSVVKYGTNLRSLAFAANSKHNPPDTTADIKCWYAKVQ